MKYALFNFNACSHLLLSLTTLYIYKFSYFPKIFFFIGHLCVSIAQYYLKYITIQDDIIFGNDINAKYISSPFGIIGHTLLSVYMILLIKDGNIDALSILYILSQLGMVGFYINNVVSSLNTKKIILFSCSLIFLSFYHIVMTFKINDFSKYPYILVAIVYINILMFINIHKSG